MAELITYAFLRAETDISQNIPDSELKVPLKRAQTVLKGTLGVPFYDQIEAQFLSSSFTADNQALFDPYIKEYLAWQAFRYWLPYANFKTARSGIRTYIEPNSQPATPQEVGAMVSDSNATVKIHLEAILSFIRKQRATNSQKYPLYEDKCGPGQATSFQITGSGKGSNILLRAKRRQE